MMTTRRSPLPVPAGAPASGSAAVTLQELIGYAKLGAKGRGLTAWARKHALTIPAALYETAPAGTAEQQGLWARVGGDEIILEVPGSDPLRARFDAALDHEGEGIYRIPQQSVTLLLGGPQAHAVFAQTCGVNLAEMPAQRMVYTRVAGVSCGIIPHGNDASRHYRLWVDYTFAAGLHETLATIISEL